MEAVRAAYDFDSVPYAVDDRCCPYLDLTTGGVLLRTAKGYRTLGLVPSGIRVFPE